MELFDSLCLVFVILAIAIVGKKEVLNDIRGDVHPPIRSWGVIALGSDPFEPVDLPSQKVLASFDPSPGSRRMISIPLPLSHSLAMPPWPPVPSLLPLRYVVVAHNPASTIPKPQRRATAARASSARFARHSTAPHLAQH